MITGTKFPFGRDRVGIVDQDYKYYAKKSGSSLWELQLYNVTDHHDRPALDRKVKEQFAVILKKFQRDSMLYLQEQ